MKKSSPFKPKADVKEYQKNRFNKHLYRKLTEDFSTLKELFPEPLIFFNLLYEQIHFINDNKDELITFKKHFEELSIEPVEKVHLLEWIRAYIWETNIIEGEKWEIIDEALHETALEIGELQRELKESFPTAKSKESKQSSIKPSHITHEKPTNTIMNQIDYELQLEQINQRLSRIEQMLLANKAVLKMAEVALYTGLSMSYLYKLTSTGGIPCYKPLGKHIYFKKDEIDQWLLSNRKTPSSEIEQQADTYVTLNQSKD